MDRLEFIALVSNAPGYPGLETLSALTFGFRLEVVGTAVSAASRTPLEETSSGEFVTGRKHIFVIRLGIVSRVAWQIFEILSFCRTALKVCCGSAGAFRLQDSADASFCLWVSPLP